MSYPYEDEETSEGEGEGEGRKEALPGRTPKNQARESGEGPARPEEAEETGYKNSGADGRGTGCGGQQYARAAPSFGRGQGSAARESGEGPSGPREGAEEDDPGPVSETARRGE